MTRLAAVPNIANSWQRYCCQLPAVTEPLHTALTHLVTRNWCRSKLREVNESIEKFRDIQLKLDKDTP